MSETRDLEVALTPLPPLTELETLWLDLQERSRPSFYLSWPWIRTWVSSLPPRFDCRLIVVRSARVVLGLGVIVAAVLHRHRALRSCTWSLNSTGIPEYDCMFIEHNGLLVRRDDEARVISAVADAFDSHEWDELRFPGVNMRFVQAWRDRRYRLREDMVLTSRYVDLTEVRAHAPDYIQSLGTNTRARIRRTARDFETNYGPLVLDEAVTLNQAERFYAELKALHQSAWIARGERGSFASEHFDRFHRALIGDFFASRCIQLLRLTAGSRTVGLLYNFVANGEASMYQSGFDYSLMTAPNKQSPGLLTHAFAIQHNLARGLARYDFLGGDNQYKQVLANRSEEMWWGRVQRDALKFRVEDLAAHWWRRVRARSTASTSA